MIGCEDHVIADQLISFLIQLMKNVPSKFKIIDKLKSLIYLNPYRNKKEIEAYKNKNNHIEDRKITFKEVFGDIDNFANLLDFQSEINQEQLEKSNVCLKGELDRLRKENEELTKDIKNKQKLEDIIQGHRKEKFELLRKQLEQSLMYIKTKNENVILMADHRKLGHIEENYKQLQHKYNSNKEEKMMYANLLFKDKGHLKGYKEALFDKFNYLTKTNNKLGHYTTKFKSLLLTCYKQLKKANMIDRTVSNQFFDNTISRTKLKKNQIPQKIIQTRKSLKNIKNINQSSQNPNSKKKRKGILNILKKESIVLENNNSGSNIDYNEQAKSSEMLQTILYDMYSNGMSIEQKELIFEMISLLKTNFERLAKTLNDFNIKFKDLLNI